MVGASCCLYCDLFEGKLSCLYSDFCIRLGSSCASCWLNDQIVSTVGQDHQTLISAFKYIISHKQITRDELGIRTLLRQF